MRHARFILPAFGLTLVLAACGGKAPSTDHAADTSVPTATSSPSPASTEATAQGQNGMIKECPGARLHLATLPRQDGAAATKTQVELERDGQRQALAAPPEMADYTAVGLGCAEDGKGSAYFVVQYGELPYGCEFCEWFFLYDTQGHLLNHATPPLREEDGQQGPNNDEYQHKLEALGLKHPEMVPYPS